MGCRWIVMVLVGVAGCASIRTTDPPRTASEQYLLSEAARRAVDELPVTGMRDKQVFVDTTYLGAALSAEQLFAVAELRAKLMEGGARIVLTREKSQVVVEVRSGALGVDRWDNLLGIPSFGVPAALSPVAASAAVTPELALLKSTKQHGFATFSYVAYWVDTGEVLATGGPVTGRTIREDFWILGIGPKSSGNIVTTDHLKEPEPMDPGQTEPRR